MEPWEGKMTGTLNLESISTRLQRIATTGAQRNRPSCSEPMIRRAGCASRARPDPWEPRVGDYPGRPDRSTPSRWTALGSRGFRYRHGERTPDGIQRALVGTGGTGRAKAMVTGTGANLSGRAFGLPAPPLGLPLRVQLQAENGACFEATYSAVDVVRNEPGRFRTCADP